MVHQKFCRVIMVESLKVLLSSSNVHGAYKLNMENPELLKYKA